MTGSIPRNESEIAAQDALSHCREKSSSAYNARVEWIHRCHAELMRIRVAIDEGLASYEAGQYTVLALGSWERRVAGVQAEVPSQSPHLIKRAYSISCPMVDDAGRLMTVTQSPWLEFLVLLVRHADGKAPALTPRLFALEVGDRLFCSPSARGRYTLAGVSRSDDVVLFATGTGEAPHNAMISELLARGHHGRIVSVTCARYNQDLAYYQVHRELERRFANYRYIALTTREPRNLDASRVDYIGKRYLQDYVKDGSLEREGGIRLNPDRTHVFLCGSHEMIGAPHAAHASIPGGMVHVLESLGFEIDRPHQPGNLHYETYW